MSISVWILQGSNCRPVHSDFDGEVFSLTVNNGTNDLMNLAISHIATSSSCTKCSCKIAPYGLEGAPSSDWPYGGRGSEKGPGEATEIVSVLRG